MNKSLYCILEEYYANNKPKSDFSLSPLITAISEQIKTTGGITSAKLEDLKIKQQYEAEKFLQEQEQKQKEFKQQIMQDIQQFIETYGLPDAEI